MSSFRKNVTVTEVDVGTNCGNRKVIWYGKLNRNNTRSSILKSVRSATAANDDISEVDAQIMDGNFMINNISESTKTYECDYSKFFEIAVPIFND